MFTNLLKEIERERKARNKESAEIVRLGYLKKWKNCEQPKTQEQKDAYIKRSLTAKQWEKYQSGKITRSEAVKIAIKKETAKNDEYASKQIAKVTEADQTTQAEHITIKVEWHRSSTWGNNPRAEVWGGGCYSVGTASGCGYDKESASIAEAVNANAHILKALYIAEEKRLKKQKNKRPSRRDFLGYGSGYGVLPYLGEGVGASCFVHIFQALGYETTEAHGNIWDFYEFKLKKGKR